MQTRLNPIAGQRNVGRIVETVIEDYQHHEFSLDGKLVEVPMKNDDDCLEVDTDVSIRKRAGLKKLLRARLHHIENTNAAKDFDVINHKVIIITLVPSLSLVCYGNQLSLNFPAIFPVKKESLRLKLV